MLWRLGLFSGPSFHLLLLLQLSQNLSDVLVDLEKQHGGNTVMVKPQPRCVTASLQLWAGVWGGPGELLGSPTPAGPGKAGPCALVASLRSGEQARLPTPQACPIRAGPRWAVCRSPELGLAFPLWPGDEMIHGQQGEAVWEASCPPRAPPFPFPALGKPRALDGGTGTTPFLSWAPQNPSHGRRSLLPEGK